jgi:hypothetical protein
MGTMASSTIIKASKPSPAVHAERFANCRWCQLPAVGAGADVAAGAVGGVAAVGGAMLLLDLLVLLHYHTICIRTLLGRRRTRRSSKMLSLSLLMPLIPIAADFDTETAVAAARAAPDGLVVAVSTEL